MKPPLSAAESFDGTVLARFFLGTDDENSPPRIDRFSFEGDVSYVPTSSSGQFASCHGLAYDEMNSPRRDRDVAASHQFSRGPHTPPAVQNHKALPQGISLSPTQDQPTDDPFLKGSPTLFSNTRSFLVPGHSLLRATPSFLQLKIRSQTGSPKQSPTRSPQSPPAQPMSMSSSHSQQTISRNARPSLDSTISTSSNRRVTVQQLALDFPLARSRSSSLSVLIHALEDASPGWYQSLMDSALPRANSQSPISPSSDVLWRDTHPSSPTQLGKCALNRESLVPISGLPPDMLVVLEELEALATCIGQLPFPRPRTMAFHIVESAFFSQTNTVSPLASPPSSPTDSVRHREAAVVPAHLAQTSPQQLPSSQSASSSDSLRNINQPAAANIVHHPKLAKTLGLRHVPSRRLLSSGLRTVSDEGPRPRSSSNTFSSRVQAPSVRAFPQTPQKATAVPPKTPKTLKLQSLFRRRPSAPPMPMQEYELGGSPVQSSIRDRRAAHLSEPGMMHMRRAVSGTTAGHVKHFSSTAQASGSLMQRQPPLGSFLPM